MENSFQPDAVIIGSGLAGLVAAMEITSAGKKVLLLDQETEQNIGGQAFWSFGGLFLINSPQQRKVGIKDSYELARQDWMGTAGFDREEDHWPRQWAEAYLKFAAGEKYEYISKMGIRLMFMVGWAERGDGNASGHGNSVPRFHVSWGTGTGVVKPFVEKAYEAQKKGLLQMKFRHRVTALISEDNTIIGVKGDILEADNKERGVATNRNITGTFEYKAANIIITSGGIGANHELVRKNWPERLGNPPENMVCGVPAYVDGKMIAIAENAGAHIINRDRMWHYTEGLQNWNPIWHNHGIRILPGPSSLWLDAKGKRLPAPFLPGFDTLGTLKYIQDTGYGYSWFILTQKIIKKEFALSGSEQNPDITNKDYRLFLSRIFGKKAPAPVEAFKEKGKDFIVSDNLQELVQRMNELSGDHLLDYAEIKSLIEDRDRELNNKFSKDTQVNYIRSTRKYIGDKLGRVAKLHKILDPENGPLIAVRLNILTRKTLGGMKTNLNGQVLREDGSVLNGLYAAGEVSGFGGGGMHGYRALEGTFLGGCIFSGMKAGKYIGGL
ncbi:FAD-binding dehydrogenase [Elizabethkingia meningoseptica]|uniref:FAD-binding dehydrogenase n=1 Tax=Elizabethkingia meningoseptica TaxID=238 RepID=UPI000332BECC|nr:FAD-binding dehydrogenase [Elizabethkingia meningoseptica]AQX07036.1 FAD-binding dehydrogenase [Elizabethkingia meningoseptica]AQX47475.1 FAD-binding dehydrogenase [Elizabethkingia meningoseptica]EOR29721.1 FAD-binding dehydrogenase [Elizabethkingia meningoseptica ATCC 13253 = NBRC 12535]KUY24259.1 FAD-binding dehydrogenase [Elizabethkingia meningoseptica]MDE5489556.1 FAD-binding dehydrogenase [Elizabethkingia meningoseptica]